MKRYICIHGHFYQPPRENPWLETIEFQDSAAPYHDWNKRITAECYAPNAQSRILDDNSRITQIVNNYSRISFNFGPTLLAWMEESSPHVYEAILEADKESRDRFSGHGSALAQAYNHMILPLATTRDKTTQILWGIRDFEYRFNRRPRGMWIPETAVDMESLDIMADAGIDFTILAPHQARRVRPIDSKEWQKVNEGEILTTMPYRLNLPSGRHITIFFYHGGISRAVAFERLLVNGESFAKRLLSGFTDENNGRTAQMMHIATDGESYGHHHRFGEMALSFALHFIEAEGLADLTNYGEFLEKYPPTFEAEIHENTSWSCAHGVERWRNDCGCHTGAHSSWNQKWRAPLREALDQVRDTITPLFEKNGGEILRDPWKARNDYIQVILDRSEERISAFIKQHARDRLDPKQRINLLKLMELQRHAMLMGTSCGWFFDDLSGIETIQIMQYAFRAIQLTHEIFGEDLEPMFLKGLARADSNDPGAGNGARIYEKSVRTALVDLKKASLNYAIDSLFKENMADIRVSGHSFENQHLQQFGAGNARLKFGRVTARSRITEDSEAFYFGLLHLGDHNLTCGIREYHDIADYDALISEVADAFGKADIPETLRRLDGHFGSSTYSLKSLHRDEQRGIMKQILRSTEEDIQATYRHLYEKYVPLLLFLQDSETIPPKTLITAAELVLYGELVQALDQEELDPDQVREIMGKADELGIFFEEGPLEFKFRKSLERMSMNLALAPDDMGRLKNLNEALDVVKSLKFDVNLWTIQNVCYDMLQSRYPIMKKGAARGDDTAREWLDQFVVLCEHLSVFIPG